MLHVKNGDAVSKLEAIPEPGWLEIPLGKRAELAKGYAEITAEEDNAVDLGLLLVDVGLGRGNWHFRHLE